MTVPEPPGSAAILGASGAGETPARPGKASSEVLYGAFLFKMSIADDFYVIEGTARTRSRGASAVEYGTQNATGGTNHRPPDAVFLACMQPKSAAGSGCEKPEVRVDQGEAPLPGFELAKDA